MLNRIRTAIILGLLGAVTAAGTGEAASTETPEQGHISEEHKNELLRAKTCVVYALVTYQSNAEACRGYVGYAAEALKRTSQRYEKGSLQRDYVEAAAEYLVTVEEHLRLRAAEGIPASPKDTAAETTKMSRISAGVSALLRGEAVDPLVLHANFKLLREEVKKNEAAGKGDIETQIKALRGEAARLNREAEVVEAENLILEDKVARVKEAVDFWKSLMGEDMAFLCPWGKN
jgi:hypothetical protein